MEATSLHAPLATGSPEWVRPPMLPPRGLLSGMDANDRAGTQSKTRW